MSITTNGVAAAIVAATTSTVNTPQSIQAVQSINVQAQQISSWNSIMSVLNLQTSTVQLLSGSNVVVNVPITANTTVLFSNILPAGTLGVQYAQSSLVVGLLGSFTVNALTASGTVQVADTSTLQYVTIL